MPRQRTRVDQRRSRTTTGRRPAEEIKRLLAKLPKPIADKLGIALGRHFDDVALCDKRGRKTSELRKVPTTLQHVDGMLRWVDDERYDLNYRRRIRKFLKHIAHGQPWQVTVDECRMARGLANRGGQMWNDKRTFGPSVAIDTGTDYTTVSLNSVEKQRSAGGRAENSLQSNAFGHHDALRNGKAEYYEIRKSGAGQAWMSVDCRTRKVIEICGPRNDEADLPDEVLWQLCRKLRVSGDDTELFFQRGVLSMFIDGVADRNKPKCVVSRYQLWSRPREVILQDSREGGWSRFVRDGWGWDATAGSELGADALKVLRDLSLQVRLLVRVAEARKTGRKKAGRRRR